MRAVASVVCALSAVLALAPGVKALHWAGGAARVPRRGNLRLTGGTDTSDALREARRRRAAGGGGEDGDGEEGDGNDLKSLAKRRAEQAKRAGSHSRDSISKTLYRVFFSATNKLGLSGSSTRIVNGQVVVRRNILQKLFHIIYVLFRAIYFFFKTLVVPLKTLEPPKRGGGGGRGSFSKTSKSNVVKMADLPPMPGG